jgi:taspase (threonine aspartase 1)
MQERTRQHRHLHISTKFDSARERLRQIRRDISTPFRKSQKYSVEIIPSPFIDSADLWPDLIQPAPQKSFYSSLDRTTSLNQVMDGAGEGAFRRGQKSQSNSNVSAIFVHAGAGYHSTTNEHIHLGACNE